MSDSITKDQLLNWMLMNGWEWTTSEFKGMVTLKKGDFLWSIDPFKIYVMTLIQVLTEEALFRAEKKSHERN